MNKPTFPPRLISRRACGWALPAAFGILAFASPPTEAAVREAWVQRYSNNIGNTADVPSTVLHDKGGVLIVAGYTGDLASGRTVW